MRYYSIVIDNPPAAFPPRYDNGAQWGTVKNGIHDPNAQQIEFQIVLLDATTPTENSTLTIYGVSWDQIVASNQLVGHSLTFNGGMSPGLPLATFQNRNLGLIIQAKILKCWGNWIGNETSIGMMLAPTGLFQSSNIPAASNE